jgi:hypothetical protein
MAFASKRLQRVGGDVPALELQMRSANSQCSRTAGSSCGRSAPIQSLAKRPHQYQAGNMLLESMQASCRNLQIRVLKSSLPNLQKCTPLYLCPGGTRTLGNFQPCAPKSTRLLQERSFMKRKAACKNRKQQFCRVSARWKARRAEDPLKEEPAIDVRELRLTLESQSRGKAEVGILSKIAYSPCLRMGLHEAELSDWLRRSSKILCISPEEDAGIPTLLSHSLENFFLAIILCGFHKHQVRIQSTYTICVVNVLLVPNFLTRTGCLSVAYSLWKNSSGSFRR